MYPHRIRLRGPWECEPLARADAGPLPPACRMTMPCRWAAGGLADFTGRVRFRRRFGFPGRIDGHERVWLTFAGVDRVAEVWLNGTGLGRHEGDGPFEFDVTNLLQVRNELVAEVEGSASHGGLFGEVALEVRCSAYLRAVRIEASNEGDAVFLHAVGEVVGNAERPLDLYLLLDGATVAYTTVTASPAGQSFRLTSEQLDMTARPEGGPHRAQIDLVNGATVWYRHEQPCRVVLSTQRKQL